LTFLAIPPTLEREEVGLRGSGRGERDILIKKESKMGSFLRASLVLFSVLTLWEGWAWSGEREEAEVLVNKARLVIEELKLHKEMDQARDLIGRSAGVAIFPGMVKGGFIVGGAYGKGVVLSHRDGRWNGPAFVYIGAGSVGFQIGAQAVDLVLVVMGQRTMEAFMRSKFKLGADAQVAAGPVGIQGSAATEIFLRGGIYSYSLTKGVFVGVSLEGAGIGRQPELNRAYYGQTVRTDEILAGKLPPPPSGKALIESLERIR